MSNIIVTRIEWSYITLLLIFKLTIVILIVGFYYGDERMNVQNRIDKAILSLQRAKEEYNNNDKRLALGSLDWVQERLTAAKYLLLDEIKRSDKK